MIARNLAAVSSFTSLLEIDSAIAPSSSRLSLSSSNVAAADF